MAQSKSQFPDGVADIGRRFGVSIKALRLYEDMGLLRPSRDDNGWRSYGQAECERLHQIVALRELGLPLAEILRLLRGGHGLAEVLTLQEQALIEQRAKTEEALAIVRRAKARLAAGEALDVDALAELVRRTKSARMRWTPELTDLANKTFDEEQRLRLAQQGREPDVAVFWAEFYEELTRLEQAGEPASPAALQLGRRAWAMINRLSGNDAGARQALANFWGQGLSDPKTAKDLPMTKAQWDFFGRIVTHLQTAGGQ
jgi:DNA-binding transcriptional MerR regulator